MLINKLRDEEMAKIPEYYSKWEKIGLEYRPINKPKARVLLTDYLAKFDVPLNHFFYFDSPLSCQFAINIFNDDPKRFINDYNKEKKPLKVKTPPHPVMTSLAKNLMEYMPAFTGIEIINKDVDNFTQFIRNYFKDHKVTYEDVYWYSFSGNLQAGYCAFYEFFVNEIHPNYDLDSKLKPEDIELWEKYKAVNEEMHIFWVYNDIAFCSEKPTELHFADNILHNFNGPACRYADGYELYYMRGVEFPEEIVKMSPEELDPELVMKETNAEKRFILAEKIGMDRLIEKCDSKTIEQINGLDLYKKEKIGNYYQHGDVIIKPEGDRIKEMKFKDLKEDMVNRLKEVTYQFVHLSFGDKQQRPYLIMDNPSIKHKHIEGVSPECKSIMDAIEFRNKIRMLPIELS